MWSRAVQVTTGKDESRARALYVYGHGNVECDVAIFEYARQNIVGPRHNLKKTKNFLLLGRTNGNSVKWRIKKRRKPVFGLVDVAGEI